MTLFGGIDVRLGDEPITGFISNKSLALLIYLAMTRRVHTRAALAGLFWPDVPEATAKVSLRQVLSNLNKLVGSHLIIQRQTAVFNTNADYWLDAQAFVTATENAQADGEWQQAATLYQGEFLAGFYVNDAKPFEEWATLERDRFQRLGLQAWEHLAAKQTEAGQFEASIAALTHLLTFAPWHEPAHRQLMRLLARQGRTEAALRQYEQCRQALASDLDVEPSTATATLFSRIQALRQRPQAHNLPHTPTPFIGRVAELETVCGLLTRHNGRLVTILGMGGTGKTRLAIEVAQRTKAHFLEGVTFVNLAGVTKPEQIAPAIARALNFNLATTPAPETQLINHLSTQERLLLLDNMEQLAEDSDFIGDLLHETQDIKVLVTSRHTLNLVQEWIFALEGMAYPTQETDDQAWSQFDGIHLFSQTAQRVQQDFSLAEEKTAVIQICQLVVGMPLAIELAAAALRDRSCAQIAANIDHNLDSLQAVWRNVPARHRSMQAVFQHSWQLLTAAEQTTFAYLSAFYGGFTQAAAAEIIGKEAQSRLQDLCDRSLVQHNAQTDYYHLHQMVQQYAASQLESDEKAAIQNRHAHYYATFVQYQFEQMRGEEKGQALQDMLMEMDNIRAAWSCAVVERETAVFSQMMDGLMNFHNIKGWYQDALHMYGAAVTCLQEADNADQVVLGRLLGQQGLFYERTSQPELARASLQQSVTLLRQQEATYYSAEPLLHLGYIAFHQDDLDNAEQYFQDSLAIFRQKDDKVYISYNLFWLGQIAYERGLYEQAEIYAGECLSLKRHLGDPRGIAMALSLVAKLAEAKDDFERALQIHEENLVVLRQLGDAHGLVYTHGAIGDMMRAQGLPAAARAQYQNVLDIIVAELDGHELFKTKFTERLNSVSDN